MGRTTLGCTMAAAALAVACGGRRDAPAPSGAEATDAAGAFCGEVAARVARWTEAARATAPRLGDRYGGTAVVGAINELPGGMNAFAATDYTAVQLQQFVNLMTLVAYTEDLEAVPYLARSWEVSDDGTELTFHLRDDVSWHDGEPTDAHDVAFTYLRATDPATAYPNAGYWDHYVRGPEGVEVLDDHTVRIGLQPHAEFLDPWRTLAIMPEHLLADVPPEELRAHPFGSRCPVGNGPFVFAEHAPQDRWVFEANPGFPEELGGRPYLDRLVYRVIPDETTLLVELLNGGVHAYVGARADQAARITASEGHELRSFAARNYTFVAWNTRKPVLADPRVRRAFTLATDRASIVSGLLGSYGRLADSGVPPFHWAFDPSLAQDGFDPEAAAELLRAAGWVDGDGDGVREAPDGTRLALSIKYNTGNQLRREIAEIMQASLARVGAEVSPVEVEWGTLVGQVFDGATRDFDGVVMAWGSDFRLDEAGLFHSERSDDPTAMAGLRSPELDELLERLQTTVERGEAVELWREYQAQLNRLHPYTYLFFPERLVGVDRRLRGALMDARGEWVSAREWWLGG